MSASSLEPTLPPRLTEVRRLRPAEASCGRSRTQQTSDLAADTLVMLASLALATHRQNLMCLEDCLSNLLRR